MVLKGMQVAGPNIANRSGCDNLFEVMNKKLDDSIKLGFSKALSISRFNAHEYINKITALT